MLKVNTNELLNILNKLNKCNGALTKTYDTFKFEVDNDNDILNVSVFDGGYVKLSGKVKCYENTKELNKSFVVTKKNLLKALKLYDDLVKIILNENNENALFSDDKKKLSLKCFTDYIDMKEMTYTKETKVNKDFTKELFKHIKYASKSEIRPILTGICLRDNTIVTTDSYRLCKTIFEQYNFENQLVIPSYIIKAIKDMKEEVKSIKYNEKMDKNYNKVSIVLNDIVIDLRTIEGTYPETDRLIPTNFNYETNLNRDKLFKDIKLLKGMCENPVVDMDFNKNELSTVLNQEENEEVFSISFENENKKDFVIRYNIQYMFELLEHMDNDKVSIHFVQELRPFIIKDGSPTLSLLLPCRKY